MEATPAAFPCGGRGYERPAVTAPKSKYAGDEPRNRELPCIGLSRSPSPWSCKLQGAGCEATSWEISLTNGVIIAVHTNSYRNIRGKTLLAVIADEVAFWRDEQSALPDIECYRAVLPSLARTNEMLIAISTPYRKAGLLHTKFQDHYDTDDVLVVRGSTQVSDDQPTRHRQGHPR